MNVADLFPETLLVSRQGGYLFTDSVRVAAHFHKQHKNVLRAIEQLIADVSEEGGHRLNFEPMSTTDQRNRKRFMYRMDRKAFAVLAGRFTGRRALLWQIQYHEAFEAMEAQLAAAEARYVAALDILRPALRPTVEDFEAGLPRAATAARLGRSVGSVTYQRGVGRRVGLLAARRAGGAA